MSLTAPHSTQTGEFSRQHDNQQQPQGKGAAAEGPGHRWLSYNKHFYLSHRQTSFSFAPACQWYGQPLLSPDSTSSLTVRLPIDEDSEEAVLEGQTMPLQDIQI